MQPAGQYSVGSYYTAAPGTVAAVPDPHPYTNLVCTYGSAPPYTPSTVYHAPSLVDAPYQKQDAPTYAPHPSPYPTRDAPYQKQDAPTYAPQPSSYPSQDAPTYAPHPPSYVPSQPSLADSLAALNISPQGSYSAPQASPYAPTVPSHEQSYYPQIGPSVSSNIHQPPSNNNTIGGQSFPSHSQVNFDGHYGTDRQSSQLYGHGSTLSQSNIGIYEQAGGLYGESRGYDRSTYGQEGLYGESRGYDRSAYGQETGYDKASQSGYDHQPAKGGYDFMDVGIGEVFAYEGGTVEPYGSRGTGTTSSRKASESVPSSAKASYPSFLESRSSSLPKAVPKVDKEEGDNGVQKYRVKLLGDSNGPMDVLCQIGLDGVRMIAPSTSKTVKIYPLETITRWEVNEPSVFTFWAKSAVDIEPRKIKLQSGSYTTNTILDTLTAACVQFSEMVGKDGSLDSMPASDIGKGTEQAQEKKRASFAAWMTLRNRQTIPEEKDHWVPDEAVTKCSACSSEFGAFLRRHHCRNCGDVFCDKCTHGRTALTADEDAPIVRVCDLCLAEVTQRLSNAKQLSSKPPAPRSHEDLAKKLQEELERNAPRRSRSNPFSSHGKERSTQTTILNCNACGSISLVNENSSRCPACGADTSASRSGRERGSSVKSSSISRSNQSNFESSGKRMREVACPTCTVHLQVQVPSSGSETVECGICQHPFLVSA